jgi:hypothetical protein
MTDQLIEKSHLTPAEEVRMTCKSLGEGGQSELARLLPSRVPGKTINSRTVRRWLAGKSTPSDEVLERIRTIGQEVGYIDCRT